MSKVSKYAYNLFVSYAEEDKAWVKDYLLDALVKTGLKIHSEEAFKLGMPRLVEFERAVKQSRRVLLVMTPAYVANYFDEFANLLAQFYGLETQTWPVIPLILKPVKIPLRLTHLVSLNAVSPDDWSDVVARLCHELKVPVPSPTPFPDCPYPGMHPFTEDQWDNFFGRASEIQDAVELLYLYPFLTVIGPSGSGKSSLVFAGVLPVLRLNRRFASELSVVQTIRPGDKPLTTLKTFLSNNNGEDESQYFLLIIDQFEEVFTHAGNEALPFQEALLKLIQKANIYVILTIRADFYPDLMTSPLWPQIRGNRLEITPLSKDELRQAIVKPAKNVNVTIEAALVDRLLDEASGEPGVLPLVQETLVQLWERLERRFLPLTAYDALVPARGVYSGLGRTGLQVAVARRADVTLAQLSPKEQIIARRIFLRLVQFGEGREDTRRQQIVVELQSYGDDPIEFEKILQHLTDNRLLALSSDESDPKRLVDISHEALINGWPKLRTWIRERREAEQTRRRLEFRATEWKYIRRREGGLLDEIELREAELWIKDPDAAELGYSETLSALVQTSRKAIDTTKEVEKVNHRRQLEQAQQLATAAEARHRAETQRAIEAERRVGEQAKSRQRFGLLTILLTCLLGYTIYQRAEVTNQLTKWQVSEALRLALLAETNWDKPGKSIVLAFESLAIHPNFQSERILRKLLLLDSIEAEEWLSPKIFQYGNGDSIIDLEVTSTDRIYFTSENGFVCGRNVNTHIQDCTDIIKQRLGSSNDYDDYKVIDFAIVDNENFVFVVDTPRNPDSKQTVIIWNGNNSTFQTIPHIEPINSITFSSDGSRLLTATNDSSARLWNHQGQLLQTFTHDSAVRSAVFNPSNETQILTASDDGTARLWNPFDNRELLIGLWGSFDNQKLPIVQSPFLTFTHNSAVRSAVFNPSNETQILTASDDGIARLWEVPSDNSDVSAEGKLKCRFPHNDKGLIAMFDPYQVDRVLTASLDGIVILWKTCDDEDGEPDQEAYIQDPTAENIGKALLTFEHDMSLINAEFNPIVYNQILVTLSDGTLYLWSSNCLEEVPQNFRELITTSLCDSLPSIKNYRRESKSRARDSRDFLMQVFEHGNHIAHVEWSLGGNHVYALDTQGIVAINHIADRKQLLKIAQCVVEQGLDERDKLEFNIPYTTFNPKCPSNSKR